MEQSDLIFRLIGKDQTSPAFKSAAGNAAHLDKSVRGVDESMANLSRWGKAGALALGTGFVVAGAAAAKFGVAAATAASDFGEVSAAIDQTFGTEAAADLQTWAKTSATALGQSKTQALDAAKTFGVFGRAAGLTGTDLSTFSVDLTELATDLASFNNTSPEEAIEALGAGLRGESEPLRRYGVLLDDATLKARAMQMGIYDGTDSLTQQQRVLAAQAEIMAQTSLQQGDFARTQGGMANQLRETTAQWENIKIAAGAAIVPIVEQYLPMVNAGLEDFAGWIEGNMPAIQATMTGWADKVIESYPQVAAQIGEIADGVQRNWPDIVDTAKTLGEAVERVGIMAKTMFDAFRELPPELQAFIATVAVLQKTGVLTIGFKAADIVKDLFASKVPVMNVGVLNAGGVPGAAGGAAGGAGSSLLRGALAITAVGAVSVIGTQVLIDKADQWAPKAQAAYTKTPTVNTGGGIATPDNFAIIEAKKAMEGFVWVTDQAASSEAALTLRHKEQLAGLQGVIASANVGTRSLGTMGQTIRAAGTAAGLSAEQVNAMTSAAYRVPPGTSVDQLAQAIRDAGTAAGLSDAQIDTLAASAYAVPGSANLPALKSAIDAAGASGAWTTAQTNIMSAAVDAIPPGATAAQMGEAIREAGVKAGLTDQQIQGVTAAVNAVPPNKAATITTNAPEETEKVRGLQAAINGLEGRENIRVGVTIEGNTGGGGSSTFSGSTSAVGGWMDAQVAALAEKLAPTLMGVTGGAYAGPGGGILGRPMSDYVVSSEFGPRGGAMHYGIDLAAPMGQGIFASAPGLITQSGWNGGYGNFISMDHGLGVVTRYGHMSALIGRAGQVVGQGALIGQVGSTGDSTGPHLHFEVMAGGNFVNPRTMVALRHGGLVPTALSAGEYYVPEAKAKGNYRLLSAVNAGVLSGPGTGTSDSIRAMAKTGDFIVNAKASRRHKALLDSVVKGPRRMATGGVVGGTVAGGAVAGGTTTVQLLLDGRALHESLIRYQRETGTADLFPVRA